MAAILAAALLAVAPRLQAQNAEDGARQDLDRVEQELADRRARAELLGDEAARLGNDLRLLRRDLVALAGETQTAEAAVSQTEERLQSLDAQEKQQLEKLGHRRRELAGTMVTLTRLARRSPTAFLANTNSTIDTYRGIRMMGAVSVGLAAEAGRIRTAIARLALLRRDIDAERQRRSERVETLARNRSRLARLLEEKARLEQRTRAAGRQESRNVSRLVDEAQDLRDLVAKLAAAEARRRVEEAERARAERRRALARMVERHRRAAGQVHARVEEARRRQAAREAAEAAAEAARVAAKARRQSPPKPDQGLAAIALLPPLPAEKPAPPARSTASAEKPKPPPVRKAAAATVVRAKIHSRKRFSRARGKIPLPARGRLISRFGTRNSLGQTARGILLETLVGAQVTSPFDGEVVFAGKFRDYGLLLIISLGEGYHILLSGMSRLHGIVGQNVLAGEPIAEMGTIDAGRPRLYVELRQRGEPINPLPWMSAALRKVSG